MKARVVRFGNSFTLDSSTTYNNNFNINILLMINLVIVVTFIMSQDEKA